MRFTLTIVIAAAVGFMLGAVYSVRAAPGIEDIVRGEAERQVQDAIANALKVDLKDGQGRVEIGDEGVSIYDSRDRLVSRYDANGSYHAKPEQFSEIRVPQDAGGYLVINGEGMWHVNDGGPGHGLTAKGLCTHGGAGGGSHPLVCIEPRFIEVQDNFLRDIGVDWRGLGEAGTTEFLQSGVTLDVQPTITPDDEITLELRPEVSTLDGSSAIVDGLPQLINTRVVTQVLVDNGDTVVLGGLLRNVEVETTNKIPILSDIPVLGYFFKALEAQERERTLMIMVTPTVITAQ